jgi:hypothetical protein
MVDLNWIRFFFKLFDLYCMMMTNYSLQFVVIVTTLN